MLPAAELVTVRVELVAVVPLPMSALTVWLKPGRSNFPVSVRLDCGSDGQIGSGVESIRNSEFELCNCPESRNDRFPDSGAIRGIHTFKDDVAGAGDLSNLPPLLAMGLLTVMPCPPADGELKMRSRLVPVCVMVPEKTIVEPPLAVQNGCRWSGWDSVMLPLSVLVFPGCYY